MKIIENRWNSIKSKQSGHEQKVTSSPQIYTHPTAPITPITPRSIWLKFQLRVPQETTFWDTSDFGIFTPIEMDWDVVMWSITMTMTKTTTTHWFTLIEYFYLNKRKKTRKIILHLFCSWWFFVEHVLRSL